MTLTGKTMETLSIPPFHIRTRHGRTLLDTGFLHLPKGGVTAITGPSGAGKSLFLKSLFGWATPGQEAVLRPGDGACLMIQDPSRGLTPSLNLAGHFRELGGRGWRDKALALLADLNLTEPNMLKRYPDSFSGGERQRIMFALTLMREIDVLVCDEPAASLGDDDEARFWDLLTRYKDKLTLIFVTHQIELIEKQADHVLLINEGAICFSGSTRDFFENPASDEHQRLIKVYRQDSSRDFQASSESTPLLETRELTHGFGERTLYSKLNWQVSPNSWWWLAGPSGTGKTTLGRIIAGLSHANEGVVYFQGEELPQRIKDRSPQLRRSIQYVFQHGSRALNPSVSIRKQLEDAWKDDPDQLRHYLEKLNLTGLNLNKSVSAFSLGEAQRLNLLRALSTQPKLLICDEVFAQLDLALKYDLIHFLDEWRNEHETAIIFISHDTAARRWAPGEVLDLQQVN